MSDSSPALPNAYTVLRVPNFRKYLGLRLMYSFAVEIMAVSVGFFVYDLTGNPLYLGLIGLAEAIPAISISLWAGHLADKYKRRNIMLICLVLLLFSSVFLLLLALQRESLSTGFIVTGIFSIIFFTGLARGFYSPANFALLPQLIERKLLPTAIAWVSSTWKVASVSGIVVGLVLELFSLGVVTVFMIMTALFTIGLIIILQIPAPPAPEFNTKEPALVRIKDGLRFVFNDQRIIGAIALDLFAVLFGGAVALLPVFTEDILHVGLGWLFILRSAMSLGAIVTAFFLAHRPLGANAGRLMLVCVAGFGLSIIGFGLSTIFWLSFAFLFLAGAMDEISVYVRSSLIHHATPENMKGRVSSVSTIFITSSNEIGAFESGLVASLIGTVPAVVFGGSMTLLVVAITWFRAPKLRDLDMREIAEG